MKCPHCLTDFHDEIRFTYIGQDADGHWALENTLCPACQRVILWLVNGDLPLYRASRVVDFQNVAKRIMVRPRGVSRPPVPSQVPTDIAEDYREACLVIADSPKASAALSRRCLQHVLRTAAGVRPADLANEIQQVLDSHKLPSQLAESIDAIRNIGNFSAHPIKSTSSGEIISVEAHEADWNLDVLEALFDFYYVQPDTLAKKRAALNAKLNTAGKPPLKA